MKKVDIISNIVARKGEALATPSKDISKVNLSGYLLKSIWDKVFEIRTDSQGTEYIFGKIPVVTQYGITMYSGDGVDIPSLASGLPFDGRTIWYNPDTQQIEVIGGTGGGSGEGVSNFWDLSGIPSWITNSKPKYTYSEIEGTPDLTKYALVSQIPSLSGYATESWVTKQNYATKATTLSGYGITDAYTKMNVDDLLKAYVTLGGTQTITGEKNFTGGLKVNGSPIYYDTEKKYWKLDGDLLVTGGVTMYGSDSSFTPSTIMDAIAVDGITISKSGGVLKVIGGTGGGVADSVAWANITGKPTFASVATSGKYSDLSGTPSSLPASDVYSWAKAANKPSYTWSEITSKPTWIGTSKPSYSYSEITGAISTTELQNYLTSNSYLNVTSGDNRYLMLSGGDLSGNIFINTYASNRTAQSYIRINKGSEYFGMGTSASNISVFSLGTVNGDNTWKKEAIQFYDNGTVNFLTIPTVDANKVLHEGNYSLYALPLSGGTLTGNLTITTTGWGNQLSILETSSNDSVVRFYSNSKDSFLGALGFTPNKSPIINIGGIGSFTIWHEGNDGSGSRLDADLLDGQHLSDILASNVASATKATYLKTQYSKSTSWYDDSLLYAKWATDKADHLDIKIDGYYTRVDVAKKLNTARTIWGQSFDGTGDISGHMTLTTGFDAGGVNMFLVTDNAYVGSIWYSSVWKGKTHTFGTNGLTAMTILENGNVGIGTTSPSYKLDVNGDIATSQYLRVKAWTGYGSGSCDMWYDGTNTRLDMGSGLKVAYNILVGGGITMYSDQRKKTILNHVELSLKQIADAPLIEHYYNGDDKRTTHVGSIAQYWASMNDWFCKLDSEGYYTMEIQNAALASAISIARELDRYETKTDKAIKKLKKRICELEEEVERLKAS